MPRAGRLAAPDASALVDAAAARHVPLSVVALDEPAVKGGIAISGIFDLEPIRLNYLNAKLGLDKEAVQRLSPLLNLPKVSVPLMLACGTNELPELQRQSAALAHARAQGALPGLLTCLPLRNHFTILEDLAQPDGAITALVRELVNA